MKQFVPLIYAWLLILLVKVFDGKSFPPLVFCEGVLCIGYVLSCVVPNVFFFEFSLIITGIKCIGICNVEISTFNTAMKKSLKMCRNCGHQCVMTHPAPIFSPHQAKE